LTALDESVAERCGSPSGSPDCLVIIEEPPVAEDQRATCRVGSFTYDPEPINVETGGGESGRLLQRGTEVRVTTDCTPQGGAGTETP
jgi:hypothetical protein